MDEYRTTEIALEDVQSRVPALQLSLSRVGVTGVEKVIRVRHDGRRAALLRASSNASSTWGRARRARTCRASRRSSTTRSARSSWARARSAPRRSPSTSPRACASARTRRRAEVTIKARYPEHKPAPVSGIETQEIYTLLGSAVAGPTGTRRLIGVTATGMTACPCAQTLVQESSRERLLEQGFSDDEIERVFEAVPVATHNQRGIGTLRDRLPGGLRDRHRRARAGQDRRGLDVVGDLRADEALRRGRRGREGPPPPALRRGLRARDDRRRARQRSPNCRRRVRLRAPGEPRVDPPAQRHRRALRPARRAAPRARHRRALRASCLDARVARRRRASGAEHPRAAGRSTRRPTARSPRP